MLTCQTIPKNKSNAENASSGIISAWRKYCNRNTHSQHHKTAFDLCSCIHYLLRNGWCWLPEESASYESLCLRLSGVFLLRVSLGADRSMLLLLRRLLELRLGLTSGLSWVCGKKWDSQLNRAIIYINVKIIYVSTEAERQIKSGWCAWCERCSVLPEDHRNVMGRPTGVCSEVALS